jgi:hypothetical protein
MDDLRRYTALAETREQAALLGSKTRPLGLICRLSQECSPLPDPFLIAKHKLSIRLLNRECYR